VVVVTIRIQACGWGFDGSVITENPQTFIEIFSSSNWIWTLELGKVLR
jgi:hypothetical protein